MAGFQHRSSSSPRPIGFLVCSCMLALVPCVRNLNFTYTSFVQQDSTNFSYDGTADLGLGALKITGDSLKLLDLQNKAGRVLYKHPIKLMRKKSLTSFNTSFVMNILPVNGSIGLGEGLAFIMTSNPNLPMNSQGMWLGIYNQTTDGAPETLLAIEFDTRKNHHEAYEDEGNHVGVDRFSINSKQEVNLTKHGVNISDGFNTSVTICYDGERKELTVDVSKGNKLRYSCSINSVISSIDLDLSKRLPPGEVYVGFSGSTSDFIELNYIYAWSFVSKDRSEPAILLWLWILLPLVLVLSVAAAFILFRRRISCSGRHQTRRARSNMESELMNSTKGPRKFRLKDLRDATMNFDPKGKLGQGGFGAVYRGLLRASQEQIAVKRVSRDSRQGVQEFVSEVTTIGKLSHKNLARLVGWCCEKNELLLVYEFLSNGSLDKHLFHGEVSNPDGSATLSWEKRHKILCGVASALSYLHDGCHKRVLHRDVKASNVMLDAHYNARLGDFGLARTIEQHGQTHHTTHVAAGTPGFMAPEYCMTGKASAESDVYGFGALALEVATGRRPSSAHRRNHYDNNVIDWVWYLYSQQRVLEAADPNLHGQFNETQVETVFRLALACCHPNPNERPAMRVALQVLTAEIDPPDPPGEKPSFVWPVGVHYDAIDESSSVGGILTLTSDLRGR